MKKTKHLQAFVAVLAALFLCSSSVSAEEWLTPASEKQREIVKRFKVSLSDALDIENRYGNITVTHWDKKEIEIRVVIEAKANNDRRVEELLRYVDIDLDKHGGTVCGVTSMKNFGGNRNNERITVNYYIHKPSRVKTTLEQHYGNINLPPKNDALTELVTKYGNIKGGDFSENLSVECSYGNVWVGNLSSASFELSYCGETKAGKCKNLDIESRYSNLKIDEIESFDVEIRYGNMDIDRITRGTIESSYSNTTIKYMEKSIEIEMSYGSFDIKEVSSTFERIDAEGRYGNLTVGVPVKTSFDVIAEQMKYADYDISSQFKAETTREKEDGVSYHSKINKGNSRRVIYFEGNKYSNLKIRAKK